jgi:hypothetical protein
MVQFTNPTRDLPPVARPVNVPAAAKLLGPAQRRDLAIPVLAGQESASQTARDYDVSRKFVAQQTTKARNALDQAFAPPTDGPDDTLFWLPVTKSWIEQATLSLMLTCHSSLRGVSEFFRDVLDYPLAHTTARNIFQSTVATTRAHNASVALSPVRIGALDEIFQNGQPVLVGADVASTYCYLLSLEQHRDADTWGVRLLELKDRGFAPDATVADFGSGLRAGQKQALPGIPCRGDNFHIVAELNDGATTLVNRAFRACEDHQDLQTKQARHGRRHGRKDQSLAIHIGQAARAEHSAMALADDVNLLVAWLRHDILAVAGPCYDERCRLYDFVVAELQQRVPQAGMPLKKAVTTLANHRDELLAFAVELDAELASLAAEFQVEPALVRAVLQHQAGNPNRPEYWQQEDELHRQAHGQLHRLQVAVEQVQRRTVRASSVIENLNSRLRGYFFLRRHLGPDYLEVLQFFLNHRRFPRSERAERRDKSPRELLTGAPHPHWLEMLGYQRFERN